MGANTNAGATVWVGTTAANGLTDTYTQIGEVTKISSYGRTYNEIKHNPLASRGTQKFRGSFEDGSLTLDMADDSGDAGQLLLQTYLDTDFDYNFKIVANDAVAPASATATISVASPGVVTDTAHGLAVNTPVKFSTTGALPTGLTAGTTYYVKTVVSTDTYQLSATPGGTAINTSGTQSGVHTRQTVPAPSVRYLKAKVMSFPFGDETVDTIATRTCNLGIKSGSIVAVAKIPAA